MSGPKEVQFRGVSLITIVFCFFSVRLLSVLHGQSFFLSHNGQWPPTSKDFYTRSYPLHYFVILTFENERVFPFSMLIAKQGNYWYHFYNVFGMTRSLTGNWTRTRCQHSTTRLSRRRCAATGVQFSYISSSTYNPIYLASSVKQYVISLFRHRQM